MDKTKLILETLQMQSLSDEEKTSRHILGRLYGPIATCEESTRNGRKYNRELWEKAINDDLFKEKITNKSLFLELGHPANREETDMEKVCACIPEMPKIVDGDLYAYVDILDTNNGRLLKTLCDYGFVPGISSRGSGDIMANDEVDPETFFLETWDIVQLPAVKKARLAMCESLDENTAKLRRALTESYNAATENDRKEMKKTLENLNIKIDLTEDAKEAEESDYPWAEENPEESKMLTEAPEDEIETSEETVEEPTEETVEDEVEETVEEPTEESAEEQTIQVDVATEAVEGVAEEIKDAIEADEETSETIDEIAEAKVEEIRSAEEEVPSDEAEDAESVEHTEEPTDVEETPVEDVEAESSDDPIAEEEESSEKAGDAGLEEWVSSLKETIRQKDLLEAEVKRLKEEKTVSDAEVKKLKEELNYYKNSVKVDDLVEKASAFEKAFQSLSEQLESKDKKIRSLREECKEKHQLTESVNAKSDEVKKLQENLVAKQKELTESENRLAEQRKQDRKKLTEAVNVAREYRAKYDEVIRHYLNSKASMLGVKVGDITSRLKENYACEDIDDVCNDLLETPQHFSNALFSGIQNGGRIAFKESIEPKKAREKEQDLDDLLEFAGLK